MTNSSVPADEEAISVKVPVSSEQGFVCAFYNPDFIIYSSLGSFYIPCFIMIVLYFRIFKVLEFRIISVEGEIRNNNKF